MGKWNIYMFPIENSMEFPQKTKNTTNILPSHTTAGHIFKGM
jgi:hypothetical protein